MLRWFFWSYLVFAVIDALTLVLQVEPSAWRVSWPWFQLDELIHSAMICALFATLRAKHGDNWRDI